MRFRKCVGPLLLMGLLTACGNGTPSGGFHPNGSAAADDPSAASGGSSGGAGAATDGPGAGAPAPKTPQSALAAYRSYQLAYERAYANNDPSILDPVAMNPLLRTLTEDMAHVHAQGFIWRFHNVLNPKVQGTSGSSEVVILDCITTIGAYKYDAKTGKRLDAWRGGTSQYQAVMRYSDDTWKISDATRGGTC